MKKELLVTYSGEQSPDILISYEPEFERDGKVFAIKGSIYLPLGWNGNLEIIEVDEVGSFQTNWELETILSFTDYIQICGATDLESIGLAMKMIGYIATQEILPTGVYMEDSDIEQVNDWIIKENIKIEIKEVSEQKWKIVR